jgi:hypothetical protein
MDFKTIKFLKIEWLKNATENGGALHETIKKCKPNHVVVHSHTQGKGRIWTQMTEQQLLDNINDNNGLYEVITQFPYKVYFDIDKEQKPDPEYLNKIINKIDELFEDSDMAVSGSVTENKTSYHIILNNYMVDSEKERDQLKYIVKYLHQHFDDGFDWKVYNQNRNMKCINQSKQDKRVQEIIINDDPKKHLITAFQINEYYPIPQFLEGDEPEAPAPIKEAKLKIDIDKSFEPFNLGTLPKIPKAVLPNMDFNDITPFQLLQLLPLNKSFDHSYTHRVARFCFHNNLTLENYLTWYQQKSNDTNKLNKWRTKWTQLPQFPPMSIGAITSILMKYYPELKREKGYQKYINLFTLDESKVVKVPKLSQDIFEHTNDKFILFNTGMGSGKTYQSIEYFKTQDSFIWMAPIEALAQNTMHRLEENKINCKYYKDFKSSSEKQAKLSEYDQMIICINSLHYTQNKTYKVVVIDEIETLLNKWFNNETLKKKLECWTRFIDIIQKAERVVLLDAFTSKLTTDFINQFQNNKHTIYELIHEPQTRDIEEMASVSNWYHEIVQVLKSDKKVFIFYPYLRPHGKYPSMEMFRHKLEEKTGKKGICYNSQVDDEVLKGLKNVNVSWSASDCDFIITNTKITVGINYEMNDFHRVFISVAGFNCARDLIQVSYRCRNLIDNIIKVAYIETHNKYNTFENDSHLVENCSIYQSMVKNILIEKQAPLKQSFNYLCKKAHYNILQNKDKVNAELDNYFKTLFDDCNVYYGYKDIPDVDSNRLQVLESKLCLQEATTEDKAMIKKYYFKRMFETQIESELEFGWNERFNFFFEKISNLMDEPENLYNKISEFNKWESIFPSDDQLNKVKLNDELIERIFNEYHFKDLKKNSTAKCIIRNIYNAFFNKNVIKSKTKDKKNYTLYVDEKAIRMYEFGLQHLKRYVKTDDSDIDFISCFNDE